jgi:hypothetical protein
MAAKSNMLWSRVDCVSACPTVEYHTDTILSITCIDRRNAGTALQLGPAVDKSIALPEAPEEYDKLIARKNRTLMYGLGFEELVGVKGERALTSAVRDSFQFDGKTRIISQSAVLVEVENDSGKVITFRRPIRNESKQTRLVEAFDGALVTKPDDAAGEPTPLFLHDPGAAQYERGFRWARWRRSCAGTAGIRCCDGADAIHR